MVRVYCAGAYNADNVIDVLANIRRGIMAASEIMQEGYAVYAPWLDFQLGLTQSYMFNREEYQANSMAWLEVSDAVYVVPGWEKSAGTACEIARAKELGIPVVFRFDDLPPTVRVVKA